MAKFSVTYQIPCRYGLDELPADITKRELLYFFSFKPTERQCVQAKGRFPAHQIVLGIHLAAYRFIGRPQYYPDNTPSIIIQHLADSLKLDGDVISLIYSGHSGISPGGNICPGWPFVSCAVPYAQRALHGFPWLYGYRVCPHIPTGVSICPYNGKVSRSHTP
jgi:hypothetical protein